MSSARSEAAGDRAGHDYWAQGWENVSVPPMHDLERPSLRNWIDFQYMQVFRKVLPFGQKRSVIELGCGNSIWLAYFKKYFDAEVTGLDYTASGCRTAKSVLSHYGTDAEIIEGDIFAPAEDLKNRFDVVFTNGVVEHFENTADCLKHCAAFAKPGGKIITFIPNLKGIIGAAQKRLDRGIYDIHIPLDLDDLKRAHEEAGLTVVEGNYLMPLNLYMMNTSKFKNKPWYILIRALLALPTKCFWSLEGIGLKLPPNRALSSHIYIIAAKP
jgi:2-polyprenyl-3-methyl-5-hydroxy-6-metoxy-1,4-benzoquinol methylase